MIKLIKKLYEIQFIRFLIIGGLNTLFGYSIYAFFIFIGIRYYFAILFSTLLGVLFNFTTIGKLVFQTNRLNFKLLLKFVGVYSINYGLNTLGVFILLKFINNEYLAGLILILPVSIIIYLINKKLVFNKLNS